MQVTAGSIFPSDHWFERECSVDQNRDTESYNDVLQTRLSRLRSNFQGLEFSYVDIYSPMMDMIRDPRKYGQSPHLTICQGYYYTLTMVFRFRHITGFDETSDGCCGTGILLEVGPLCNDISMVCDDPSKYVFFDSVHTTEAANKYISDSVKQSMHANLN